MAAARAASELSEPTATAMLVVEHHIDFALGLVERYLLMKQGAGAAAGESTAASARAEIDNQLAL